MLRALSVREGKGSVSWEASQSREGTCSRGYLAAWASTAEKSRQRRQGGMEDAVEEEEEEERMLPEEDGLGFVAWSFARSGLELRGIGGGAPLLERGRSSVEL